jgi:predicted amidohydrolase
MRAHLIQMDIAWEDKPGNYRKAESLISRAAPDPGDLVLLPEMFDTGFSFNIERTADEDGSTLRFLSELARDHEVYVHGARTVHARAGVLARNHATIIDPVGKVLADYAKIHPFSLGKEHEHFQGGDEVMLWQWGADGAAGLRVCPAVCYDLRFPELFRTGLSRGAQAFAIGANWPESRAHHWRALLIARAIENQAFVFGINRVGRDPNLAYAGGSIAVGPRGEILGELVNEEAPLSVEVDPRDVRSWREKFPAWKDARLSFTPSTS